jgi:hypothetical protein
VFTTYTPEGSPRIGILVLAFDESAPIKYRTIFRVFNNEFKLLGEEVLFNGVDTFENLSVVAGKAALGGGLWISGAGRPEDPRNHFQLFWRGGAGSVVKSCTLSAVTPSDGVWSVGAVSVGKAMSVGDETGVTPGQFAYIRLGAAPYTYHYLGVVKRVTTGTITLDKHPYIWNATVTTPTSLAALDLATAKDVLFTSVRPYDHVHGRGLIKTTNSGTTLSSGEIGTSGEGHWQSANVLNWHLYRASDNAFVGKITSITDNDTAVLAANAPINLEGDEYVMRLVRSTDLVDDFVVAERSASSFAGLYTAVYSGYQWYGNVANEDENVNRVVFSAYHNLEAVDLSLNAADSIVFPGKSQFRGLGSSSAGLLVFLEDRTYILRGNDRTNFSVEQLVPEGCLCASSIVEYGGGVFWAGKSGIMFFDGASVRNLTKDNLGLYYTDSLDVFNPELDRVYGFVHKNNLIMHYTSWKSPFDPIRYEPLYANDWINSIDKYGRDSWDEFDPDYDYDDFFTENNTPIFWDRQILNNPEESSSLGEGITWGTNDPLLVSEGTGTWLLGTNIQKWGPLRKNTSITFALYLPTNAITTLSNMDFRGMSSIETEFGLKNIAGVNALINVNGTWRRRTALVDFHPAFDTNASGEDDLLVEKINMPPQDLVKGPDFYLQTKHFTVGDPILRKWFQRVLISMLLYDGALRMDLVDDDDNDEVDIEKKKHRYWELFTEKGYDWDYLGRGAPPENNPNGTVQFGVQFPKITSPSKSNWENVEGALYLWDELFTADFNRYAKRIAWRKSSVGLRLYQLNNYKKPFNGVVTRPNRLEIQGFSIGFKPLRQGRV